MTELIDIDYTKLTKKTIKLIDECYLHTNFESLPQVTFNSVYKQLTKFFHHKKFIDEYAYNILLRLDNIKHIPENYIINLPLSCCVDDYEHAVNLTSYLYKYNIKKNDLLHEVIRIGSYHHPDVCDYVIRYINKQNYPNIITDNFDFNSNEFTFCTLLNFCHRNEEIKLLYDRFDKPRSYIIQKYCLMCRNYYLYNKVIETIKFIDPTIRFDN